MDECLTRCKTPPLRYVGSKWMIAEWIIAQMPPHEHYVEPFVGSGAVFFRKHPSSIETLNDMDGELVNFFRVLRTQTDELVRAIELTPYARAEYELSLQPAPVDDLLERARRYYVGVWQSFGSTLIYRSGWQRQTTSRQRTNLPDTWNRLDGLLAAAARLKCAQIDARPALEIIRDYDSPDTLFYIDPPYVLDARSGGGRKRYRHEMTNEDHHELAAALHSIQGMALLSGYPSDLYDDLYRDWTHTTKTTTTIGNRSALEVLWINPRASSFNVLPLFAQGL